MTTKKFIYATFALIISAAILGGFEFLPKFFTRMRNYFYLSALIFLLGLFFKDFRQELKEVIHNSENILTQEKANKWTKFISILYFIIFTKIVLLKYYSFDVVDVDFSYFDWMIPSHAKGLSWYSPACDCNHFGVHATYILYFLYPFHRFLNHPLFFVLMHGIVLWVSIFPLKKLLNAFKIIPLHQVLLVFVFFNYFAVSAVLKYSFHIEVFYIPFFLALFYSLTVQNWKCFYFWAIMALSVKEDSGFYLIGIATAMFLFHKNQKKHAILLTILSVAAVALSLNYIIPLNRGTSEYRLAETASKYGPTMTVAIIGMIKNFHLVLADLFTGSWLKFLIPSAFVNITIPFFMVSILPFALIHSTALSPRMSGLALYYSAPYIPFIFYSFIIFLTSDKVAFGNIAPSKAFKNSLICFFMTYSLLVSGGSLSFPATGTQAKNLYELKKKIADGASVCAQGSIFTHFDYERDLRPLKQRCLQKRMDYYILNPEINRYPYNKEQLQHFSQKLSRFPNYKKVVLGDFQLFIKQK